MCIHYKQLPNFYTHFSYYKGLLELAQSDADGVAVDIHRLDDIPGMLHHWKEQPPVHIPVLRAVPTPTQEVP